MREVINMENSNTKGGERPLSATIADMNARIDRLKRDSHKAIDESARIVQLLVRSKTDDNIAVGDLVTEAKQVNATAFEIKKNAYELGEMSTYVVERSKEYDI